MEQETEATKTVERTPGPWASSDIRIVAPDGETVGVCYYSDFASFDVAHANAQFIVTACNAYGPMREALKAAEQFIVNGVECGCIRLPEKPDPALNTLPMIRAALNGVPQPATAKKDVG